MNTRKIILFAALAVLLAGAGFGLYLYNKPHADLNDQLPAFSLTASELFSEYEADEAGSNEKYLNKLIEVTGKVQSVEGAAATGLVVILATESMMGGGVSCAFEPADAPATLPAKGDEVKVKGLCSGMLMDVSLSRCVVSK